MLQNINPVTTPAWKKLEQHYEIMKNKHMIDLFAVDPDRFSTLSLQHLVAPL
jgi:glucose-6-phosphate isomerase